MKSINKNTVLSVIGLVIITLSVVHYSGFYEFPNPDNLPSEIELVVAFAIGLYMFIKPGQVIQFVTRLFDKLLK